MIYPVKGKGRKRAVPASLKNGSSVPVTKICQPVARSSLPASLLASASNSAARSSKSRMGFLRRWRSINRPALRIREITSRLFCPRLRASAAGRPWAMISRSSRFGPTRGRWAYCSLSDVSSSARRRLSSTLLSPSSGVTENEKGSEAHISSDCSNARRREATRRRVSIIHPPRRAKGRVVPLTGLPCLRRATR